MSSTLYWHACAINDDGLPLMRDDTLVEIGKRYEIEGEPVMCKCGYHGSERAIDMLRYAAGPWISRRPLEGVTRGGDKAVGKSFVQQPGFDATSLLREFARWCALQVIDLWDAPPVVIEYLTTGKASLMGATRDAADAGMRDTMKAIAWNSTWDAAWDATKAAARAATEDPTVSTIRTAVRSAARAATLAAAQDDARYFAMHVVMDVQNKKLTKMLLDNGVVEDTHE